MSAARRFICETDEPLDEALNLAVALQMMAADFENDSKPAAKLVSENDQ